MFLKTLTPLRPPKFPIPNPNFKISPQSLLNLSLYRCRIYKPLAKTNSRSKHLITACFSPSEGLELVSEVSEIGVEDADGVVSRIREEEEEEREVRREDFGARESVWEQMVEIMKFSGPAIGLWMCGPLMSLIDTAVIGQKSSLELAALGPGTVFCDYTSYVFMFLSIATSNMVATSLASQDKDEVQHQISILLFVGFSCGVLMLLLTRLMGAWTLAAFTGAKHAQIVPAANAYVQIRGLAWPALLVGWVAQSASLGMKDSWGPLKALTVASVVNGVGDVVLCSYLGYGIAGAAWATMVSQVIAGYMMIQALSQKGYNGFSILVPSVDELLQILTLATPVFVTMISKVAFYSLLIYFATSMGTQTVAAHQVMLQIYSMCSVFGEPLSQTAQSFMPELMYGVNRSLAKARSLLKSLLIIGALSGLILGAIGAIFPLMFPNLFSSDTAVILEMHKVLIPFFIALSVTPSIHSLEGTLLAGRDLRFVSLSMSGCFTLCSLLLMLASSSGYGLAGCWCSLVGFQWFRFFMALRRLLSPNGILHSEDLTQKLKAA